MFFGEVGRELERRGWTVSMASRRKEATVALLDAAGWPHFVASGELRRGRPGLVLEMLIRVSRLARFIAMQHVDVVVSRNPAGCIAARLTRVLSVFDTDDGSGAGIHHMLAVPFADHITSPEALSEDYGPRHRRYRSLKSLAYLHPDRYRPDPARLATVGIDPGRPIFVLRRSAYSASHDGGRSGIGESLASELVRTMSSVGHVIISSEDPTEGPLATSAVLRRSPELLREILAASSLVVTDGASVAEEAAVLGTMAVFVSDFAGERDYLDRLERDYGSIRSFRPSQRTEVQDFVGGAVARPAEVKSRAQESARRIGNDHVDLVPWYAGLVAQLFSDSRRRR